MKKLFAILIALICFAPTVAWAQEADTETGEFPGCEIYNCHCEKLYPPPLIGVYTIDLPGITSADECKTSCLGYYVDAPGEEDLVTSKLTCTQYGPSSSSGPTRDPIFPKLNVPIPGLDFEGSVKANPRSGKIESNLLGTYVSAVYQFLILAGALIAVTMLMIGGLQYAVARGDANIVSQAKTRIQNAVVGVILLLLAYNIAFLIDPATTSFDALEVEYVAKPASLARLEQIPSGNRGIAGQYRDMECPSEQELANGVKFFTTGYYKPGIDEEGYGGISPMCNIAMQCQCPLGRTSEATCQNSEHSWAPCIAFDASTDYCNVVTVERPASQGGLGWDESGPVAMETAAVDEHCLPFGTVFKVTGSPVPGVDQAIWRAVDTGDKRFIGGRRIDLFMGTGPEALERAKSVSAEVTITVCPDGSCQ